MNMKEILIKVYLMGCSRSTIAKILRIVHSKAETEDEVLAAIAAMETAETKDDTE